ncbi:hypothetical protein [Micromonospora sp. NPDC005979]|uniref:hypothetical protein n=1 Tax=Micromonospora sp. NPDC005979 TaxID=3156726 RepID=UPI0033ABCD68
MDFVTAPPLRGLGASLDLIRRLVGDDTEALDLLNQALNEQEDGPGDGNGTANRARATAKEYALRKLRKDAPALHAEVLEGRLSANAAMIKAGYRPPTFTVRADSADSIASALRRRLPPEVLSEVLNKLKG